jgi:hypothetical protein
VLETVARLCNADRFFQQSYFSVTLSARGMVGGVDERTQVRGGGGITRQAILWVNWQSVNLKYRVRYWV